MKSSKLFGKTVYALIMAVVILFTAVFSVFSYAWLVNYKKSDNFGFTANILSPYTLEIAKIDTTTAVDADGNKLDEDTIETKRTYTKLTDFIIETDNPSPGDNTTTPTKSTVTLSNMSFGTIDNVAQLKNENYVYLRLTVPKSLGDTVKINLHYNNYDENGNFIKVYRNVYSETTGEITGTKDATNETVPDNTPTDTSDDVTIANALKKIETAEEGMANDRFLLYNVAVSNTAYEANAIKAATLSTQDNTTDPPTVTEPELKFKKEDIKFDTFAQYNDPANNTGGTTVTATNENFGSVAEGGNWYVYIRIVPNLAVFAYSIEYISHIMPCYMYFNVGATFESNPL